LSNGHWQSGSCKNVGNISQSLFFTQGVWLRFLEAAWQQKHLTVFYLTFLVSISSTFYPRIFYTKVLCATFSSYISALLFLVPKYWQKMSA
jgi:hypothetical protein